MAEDGYSSEQEIEVGFDSKLDQIFNPNNDFQE